MRSVRKKIEHGWPGSLLVTERRRKRSLGSLRVPRKPFRTSQSGAPADPRSVYFSYEVAKNATVSQLLANVTGNHAIQTNDGPITIYSNLSDLSGVAWGCGTANCRIIDQLAAY